MVNVKALQEEQHAGNKDRRALLLTMEQLEYNNDSLMGEIRKLRGEGIKKEDIKQIIYTSSAIQKTDTIELRDTIFRNEKVCIDTLIGDEWYDMRIRLEYPARVIATPRFRSHKYITAYTRKETVEPPKKCWLLRIFQKKHRVLYVSVRDKNPYIQEEESRFVQVVE